MHTQYMLIVTVTNTNRGLASCDLCFHTDRSAHARPSRNPIELNYSDDNIKPAIVFPVKCDVCIRRSPNGLWA